MSLFTFIKGRVKTLPRACTRKSSSLICSNIVNDEQAHACSLAMICIIHCSLSFQLIPQYKINGSLRIDWRTKLFQKFHECKDLDIYAFDKGYEMAFYLMREWLGSIFWLSSKLRNYVSFIGWRIQGNICFSINFYRDDYLFLIE